MPGDSRRKGAWGQGYWIDFASDLWEEDQPESRIILVSAGYTPAAADRIVYTEEDQ